MANNKDISIIISAIGWLADQCDFAQTADGKGFSGVDAPLGHALAQKSVLSPRETLAACKLIVKYQKQLNRSGIDVSGLREVQIELEKEVGSQSNLRRRDVVTGKITVDDGKFVLKTDYNSNLVADVRELLGAKWDKQTKVWTCDLCTENAIELEYIANKFGLELYKHKGWSELAPTRYVKIENDRLWVAGVNARNIIRSLPRQSGTPLNDVKFFRAIEEVDSKTIAFPLRSWIITGATLWLSSSDESDYNIERLAWARDDILRELAAAYPKSLELERIFFQRSSANYLPEDQRVNLNILPSQVADHLMPHQWVAVKALADCQHALLADQQGLGKTVEILAALEATAAFPAIVLAPATALLNWRDEVVSWLPHRAVAVLGGSIAKSDKGVDAENAAVIIINYESFSKYQEQFTKLRPTSIVLDEAQYLKSHDSERTQSVKQFCLKTDVKKIIAATGTPVMNRPNELLTILTILPSILTALGGFVFFAARYCNATSYQGLYGSYWDYSGANNLGELSNRLRETGYFIRREKASVLPQLLPKQIINTSIEITNYQEYQQAALDFNEWLKKNNSKKPRQAKKGGRKHDDNTSILSEAAVWLGWDSEEANDLTLDSDDRSEALRQMTALRQLAGSGKISAAVSFIQDFVKEEKLVVFAYHKEVQQSLINALSSVGAAPLMITAEMNAKARREVIYKFQHESAQRVIICSLKAASTAITLTAARHALMVELDWTPSALEQAEDRIHRIGQNGQVVITYLIAAGTLDDRMAAVLAGKRSNIGVLVGTGAPYGYRKDGLPRNQLPGPGRPRLDPQTRAARNKECKANWQSCNPDYMRDYMRNRRLKALVKELKQAEEELIIYKSGFEAVKNEMGYNYTKIAYEQDLAAAHAEVEKLLKKVRNKSRDNT